jgi:hypothetical protein
MPMNRQLYPRNWRKISARIRFGRAGGCCEWCGAAHGEPHPITRSVVVLTVAHLGAPYPDGTPCSKEDKRDVRPENLAALCQKCHLDFDRADHVAAARAGRQQRRLLREPMFPGLVALQPLTA